MTKHNGRYYLQYATPGTVSQWYCDTVMEGDSPVGPFRHVDYAPVSLKAGGFMGSAGHSCVFQDNHGNWWRVTTMWIGVHDLFERRLGLFPVRFDAEGRMYTDTALGDYPQIMPAGPRDPRQSPLAGWWVLSAGKKCTASSSLDGHPPDAAADENVRTWWSAQTGNAGEWFEMDLGKSCRVHAVQVNFAEQDCHAPLCGWLTITTSINCWCRRMVSSGVRCSTRARTSSRCRMTTSRCRSRSRCDSSGWPTCGCRRAASSRCVTCGSSATVAERLRRSRPAWKSSRHADDDRNVSLTWTPAAGAEGYLIRYGIAPDKLWQCVQVQGGSKKELTLHTLNRGVGYHFRVDAFNDSGLTPGDCGPPVTGLAAGQPE